MKVVTANAQIPSVTETDVETLLLSPAQIDFLGRLARGVNADMPMAFGVPHVIRTLLERLEESGTDFAGAAGEDDVTRIATHELRRGRLRRQRV